MAFSASLAPDITEGLPALLSAREASEAFKLTGTRFGVAIGGVPFLTDTTKENPYRRQSAPVQKQQFDSSKDAGEQTLDQFWLRSQTSWHRGAGITYYEPGSDETTQHRFDESMGINPWTLGEATLHKRCDLVAPVAVGAAYATSAVVGTSNAVLTNEAGVLKRRTATTTATLNSPTPILTKPVTAGSLVLAGTDTTIVSGSAAGSSVSDLWTNAPFSPVPFWAKSRIIAAVGRSLYELTTAGGDISTETALWDHPDPGWVWTDVAEAPSAILAAGHAGGTGAIYRFALEDAPSGGTPKLSQAYQVAEMPPGEAILALKVYLGAFVGIGTSRGLRVGIVSGDGQVQHGPLLVETANPVRALAARDTFLYAGIERGMPDGSSGAIRVNLGEQVEELRFAWATDAATHTTGRVDSIGFLGNTDRVALGVAGEGVYLQSDVEYEDSGFIRSGRVRYGTVEQKAFRQADLGLRIPDGAVSFYAVDATSEVFIRTVTTTASNSIGLSLNQPLGTHEYLSFRVVLTASEDKLSAPVIESLQVKALPAPPRQRLVQYSLSCFDHETPPKGVKFGARGYAWTRLAALEELESARVIVQFQDFTTGETFDGVIESVEFAQTTQDVGRSGPTFGGHLTVTARKL